MTTQKLFKQRVRERMSKTGESYAAARRHVAVQRERVEATRVDLSPAFELASDEKMREATGQGWAAWLSLLDRWGARDRKRGVTVDFLMAEHEVPGWYAQAIASGFERTRGLRVKHQQADGFTIYASKTVSVPVALLFDAFTKAPLRRQWLTDGSMTLRSSQPGKVARFTWGKGSTRVVVTFEDKGVSKSTAYVTHERLPDAEEAEVAKVRWRQRLAALKSVLASTRPSA